MSDLIQTLKGNKTSHVPVWFMRQAGRYLPEYKKVRSNFKQFLDFCYTPEAACEVTLQPITRFGFDAAILFSDILVVPHALGQKVWFEEGEGPKLEALTRKEDIDALHMEKMKEHLSPVYEAIRLIRQHLPKEKPLIGFSGSPWTLACYMLEGKGSKDYATARQFAYAHPQEMQRLMDILCDAIVHYAQQQISAGVQVFQLFDSWAGVLSPCEFEHWVIRPTQKITQKIKENHPTVPVIGFARGAGMKLADYAKHTNVDALGVDTSMPLEQVLAHHANGKVTQGNLDPIALAADKQEAIRQTKAILETTRHAPHIFNLGHGIIPSTPIEHVQAVIDTVRQWS